MVARKGAPGRVTLERRCGLMDDGSQESQRDGLVDGDLENGLVSARDGASIGATFSGWQAAASAVRRAVRFLRRAAAHVGVGRTRR